MAILVTGGAGYIGSHTCVELLQAGYEVVIIDNFSSSSLDVVNRIRVLTDRDIHYYKVDLLRKKDIEQVFEQHQIEAVIHFAGVKSVAESVAEPLTYYTVNLTGTLNLLSIMEKYQVYALVFSSTAAVYGKAESMPIKETAPLNPQSPYGRSKLMTEQAITDLASSNSKWGAVLLRYFNPVGAHPSGQIGENPSGVPTNLMPYISGVAAEDLPNLFIYGNDYPTPDGTGVRDYIHVTDLAAGHVKALEYTLEWEGTEVFNLGTGQGYSVLEMVEVFERVTGKKVPYQFTGRRPGDAAVSYADPSKAEHTLHWKAERGLDEMCHDAWKWQESLSNIINRR